MSYNFTLFVVDDAETSRHILGSAFGSVFTVESFASGAACLERMAEKTPDIFLLDVDMPEMDGYTLCRRIKEQTTGVPVIFISGLNDLESRLAGYDAGGDDFIVKPYKLAELKQKVDVLRRIGEEKSALRSKLDESDMLTSLVLSNLDEYAVLVKFLRSLNSCEKPSDVAEAILSMLKTFGLQGALQFRLPGFEMTINHAGEASPLEASIISHVRSLGTLASFKNRAAFNFERVSVLINNMPLNNPDLCGRLRDHLSIAFEMADAKLSALLTHQESSHTKTEIAGLLQLLNTTVGEKYEQARFNGSEATRKMLSELGVEFSGLGLQEAQEEKIYRIIQTQTDQLFDIFDFGAETEKTLNDLSARLGQTLASTGR